MLSVSIVAVSCVVFFVSQPNKDTFGVSSLGSLPDITQQGQQVTNPTPTVREISETNDPNETYSEAAVVTVPSIFSGKLSSALDTDWLSAMMYQEQGEYTITVTFQRNAVGQADLFSLKANTDHTAFQSVFVKNLLNAQEEQANPMTSDSEILLVRIQPPTDAVAFPLQYTVRIASAQHPIAPLSLSGLANETITETTTVTATATPSPTGTSIPNYSATPFSTEITTVTATATLSSTGTSTPNYSATPSPIVDLYEPDDLPSQAKDIEGCPDVTKCTDKIQKNHLFLNENDIDWVRFYVTAPEVTYILATTNLTFKTDTAIAIFDSTGSKQLVPENDNTETTSSASTTSFIPSKFNGRGSYLLRIRSAQANLYGPDTGYDLQFSVELPPVIPDIQSVIPPDAYDSKERVYYKTTDNTPGFAEQLLIDKPSTTHNFHVQNDIDWISFNISLLGRYKVVADNDVTMTLYNATTDGYLASTDAKLQAPTTANAIDSNDSISLKGLAITGLDEPRLSTFIDYNFSYPGTYYAKLTFPQNYALEKSAYHLRIVPLLPDPPALATQEASDLTIRDGYEYRLRYNDDIPESAPYVFPQYESNLQSLHSLTDQDWKIFMLSEPQTLNFTLYNILKNQALQLKIFRMFGSKDTPQTGMFELLPWGKVTIPDSLLKVNVEIIKNLYITDATYTFSYDFASAGAYYIGITNPDAKKGKYYQLAINRATTSAIATGTPTSSKTATPLAQGTVSPTVTATSIQSATVTTATLPLSFDEMALANSAPAGRDIWDTLLPIDNSIDTSSLIIPDGQRQLHTLHNATDQDWITLTIAEADKYTISITTDTPLQWRIFQNTPAGLKRVVEKTIASTLVYPFRPTTADTYYLYFSYPDASTSTKEPHYSVAVYTDRYYQKVRGLLENTATPSASPTGSTTVEPNASASATPANSLTVYPSITETPLGSATLTPRPTRDPNSYFSVMVVYKQGTTSSSGNSATATSQTPTSKTPSTNASAVPTKTPQPTSIPTQLPTIGKALSLKGLDQFIGAPVSGAKVSLSSLQGTIMTNLNGVAYFEQVPAGKYTVWVEYLGLLTSVVVDTSAGRSTVVYLDAVHVGAAPLRITSSNGSTSTTTTPTKSTPSATLPQTGLLDGMGIFGASCGVVFAGIKEFVALRRRRRRETEQKKVTAQDLPKK